MPAHTYFFIINGFHNTSHTLVLLLSCYDCAVDLKSTIEMDNALFELFTRQNYTKINNLIC